VPFIFGVIEVIAREEFYLDEAPKLPLQLFITVEAGVNARVLTVFTLLILLGDGRNPTLNH